MQNHEIVIVPKNHFSKRWDLFAAKTSCNEVVKAMNDFPVATFCDGTTL